MIHGHESAELKYIRRFHCRMLYHHVIDLLFTFESRLYEGICIEHDGVIVYAVLTVYGIIRTKDVKPFENPFPGLFLLKYNSDDNPTRNNHSKTHKEE